MLENRAIESQITSYLAGECAPAEQLVIAGLIQSNPEYKKIFDELKQIWENPVLQPVVDIYDVNKAWEKVNKHISVSPLTVIHTAKERKFLPYQLLRYVAGAAAVLLISFSVYQVIRSLHPPLQSLASGNASKSVDLSDGSNIALNACSKVKYPEKFGKDNREVYFWGEAFFDIASDPTRPFVIESGDTRIKVLGTSFNVNSNPNAGTTEVVVNTGTVLFYYVDKNENILGQVILHKGDKGMYDRNSHKISKQVNNDVNFMSWKTGVLVFTGTSLDEVVKVVGKRYNVIIRLDKAELANLKLTATFDNESLDSVLEVLSLIHKLQFTHNGNDYLVKKATG